MGNLSSSIRTSLAQFDWVMFLIMSITGLILGYTAIA